MKKSALVTILALNWSTAMAEPVKFEGSAGSQPAGWLLTQTGRGQARWAVEADASAPTGALVLKQSGTADYPVALKRDSRIRNGAIEVTFKAIAGREDRAAGLVWRAIDADNYYVVRANALEDNVVLYKTVSGRRSPLEIIGRKGGYGVNVPVPPGQWHTLRVAFTGNHFAVTFNGKPLFEVEDATFPEAGMVGLWTKADSVTAFDRLTIDTKN